MQMSLEVANENNGLESLPVTTQDQSTIIFQTRKVTDVAVDMSLAQMIIFDKIIQKAQPEIKQVAVYKNRAYEQLRLFEDADIDSGLIHITFKMKDFGVPRQYYNKLRETIFSLVTLPIQMKEVSPNGTIWSGYTTLLAGVKFEVGVQRCQWNSELKCFEYLEVPKEKKAYRQRKVVFQFRKDVLRDIISGGPNGYIQLVKERLSMMVSIYSNKIYKLISGFYNDRASSTNLMTSVHRISIEEFRKRMGLNNALTQTPVRNQEGDIIRFEYAPRVVRTKSGGLVEDPRLYKNIRDLKCKVLEVGKNELKEKGNIYFEYRLINASGAKVKDVSATHIEFTVLKKEKGEINLTTNGTFIIGILLEIYPNRNLPVDITPKITQDNVIELRDYINNIYSEYLSCESAKQLATIRERLTTYLKTL